MTVRRHPITGEPTLYAPERSARPNAYEREAAICPFCAGNESETPPEVAHIGEPWRVRAFPNKYPFAPYHEVIVEAPEHDADFAAIAHAADVVTMYANRYRALRAHDGVEYVALFKNHGHAAGASLPHIHSQIAGLPFVPPRTAREREAFQNSNTCPLCHSVRSPQSSVLESETWTLIDPGVHTFAGERWIVPNRHVAEMSDFTPQELAGLAAMLQSSASSMTGSYNWLFFNYPGAPRAHFRVEVAPRSSPVAGFELQTGTFIDTER